MKIRKNLFLFILIAFVLSSAISQEKIKQKNINELFNMSLTDFLDVEIVSVSKKTEKVLTAPGSIYVITEEEISRYGFIHLQDALKYVSSVYLYDPHSWVWGGQRGLVSNFSQTLLLINGREVNNLIAQEGFISKQFATHNIERIEVVASPASALYGANALAGVINIITKDANAEFEGFEVSQEYGSYNSVATSLVFGKVIGDLSIKGSIRQSSSNEADFIDFVKDTVNYSKDWVDNIYANSYINSYENPTESRPINFQLDYKGLYFGMNYYYNKQSQGLEKLRWDYTDGEDIRKMRILYGGVNTQINNSLKLKLDFQHISSFLWGRYHGALWPVSRLQSNNNISIYEFPSTITTSLGETLSSESEIKGYYPSFAHYLIDQGIIDENSITSTDVQKYFNHIYSNKNSRGSQRQRLNLLLNWKISNKSVLDLGVEYDHVNYVGLVVTDAGSGLGATYDIPVDLSKRNEVYSSVKHGIYAQLSHTFVEEKLWFIAGARVDNQNHYGTTINPRTGLVWKIFEKDIIKIMYGEAYREPNVFELSSNTDIDPAKLRALELNYSHNFGESVRLNVVGYNNTVTNFLGSVGSLIGTGVGKVENQTVIGSELRLDFKTGKLISFLNAAFIFDIYQDVLNATTGNSERSKVLSIPKQKFNIGLSYPLYKDISASLLYAYTNSFDALSGNSSIAEVYTIDSVNDVKFTLNWKGFRLKDLNMDGFITINNVLNQQYYHANIRRSGPHKFLQNGRNIHLRVVFKL